MSRLFTASSQATERRRPLSRPTACRCSRPRDRVRRGARHFVGSSYFEALIAGACVKISTFADDVLVRMPVSTRSHVSSPIFFSVVQVIAFRF